MNYLVTPHDYLDRARERLLSNEPSSLFYAAFELRCCVESRQADYLEAIEFHEVSRIKPWRVGETSRKLLTAWSDPKIARLTYHFGDAQFPTFFTPVMPRLARAVERDLGALLHAQSKFREPEDSWWRKMRKRLVEIYRDAWVACRGEHIAPPLLDRKSGHPHPMKLYSTPKSEELIARLLVLSATTKRFNLEVEYLDSPPADWRCDL